MSKELLVDGGFEAGSAAWEYYAGSGRSQTAALVGSWGATLAAFVSFSGFPPQPVVVQQRIEQVAQCAPGRAYRVAVTVQRFSPGAAVELCVENQVGVVEVLQRIEDWQAADGEPVRLAAEVEAVESALRFIVRAEFTGEAGQFGSWFVDSASVGDPGVEDLMAGNLERFVTNVKAVVEAADANIGTVFPTVQRWKTAQELQSAATFRLRDAGTLDATERRGRAVTRFWIVSARTIPENLTNRSVNYRHEIVLTGFFTHEDKFDQMLTLREAMTLVLEHLFAEELVALAAGMGDGYEGFLVDPPTMETDPAPGELADLQVKGYTGTIRIVAHEEVRRVA